MRDRRLPALEVATLLVIAGLALWSVRPLYEEWGTLLHFSQLGPFYPWVYSLEQMALRPLHMAGYLLQWALAGGAPIGVALATLLVALARYAVIRWAVTPILAPAERWVVASLAAVLFVWPGAWLGRFIGAQISALLFFLALGCCLRLARGASAAAFVAAVLSAFAALLFYQAPALAMLPAAALSAALAWRAPDAPAERRRALLAGAPFILALALYVLYAALVMGVVATGTYEAPMMGAPLSPAVVLARVAAVYASAFGQMPPTAPLLVAVAAGLLFAGPNPARGRAFVLAIVAVLLLPLLALVYQYQAHVTDPERTLLPVSVGFVLIVIVIGAWRQGKAATAGLAPAASLVAVALLAALAFAYQARTYWNLQASVIVAMLDQHLADGAAVLLEDTTGLLGDEYAFYTVPDGEGGRRTAIREALAVRGLRLDIDLCTPLGTDRQHPIARRHLQETTARCEDRAGGRAYDAVLVAKVGPKGIAIGPKPTRLVGRDRPVRFDDGGGGDAIIADGWSFQEADFRWSEGPKASLAFDLADVDAPAELVVTLAPYLGGGLAAQGVGVAIDGIDAGAWRVDRHGDYSLAIPPAALADGHVVVELSISDPTAPCRVAETGDCRELGVALHRLVVR